MSCPAHLSIFHRPVQRLACVHPWRVLSERVPRDSQTSALTCSVRSTSDFTCSVPARNTCMAPVAAHHDMTACLCVSLFISRGVLDEHASSSVAQCKALRAGAAQGRLGCSTIRARRPSLPPPLSIGPFTCRQNLKLRTILHGQATRQPSCPINNRCWLS